MSYSIIYADPPWKYDGFQSDKATNRSGPDKYYPTMPTDEICKLPISEISADNSILFIWGTWSHLPDCLRVIQAWGFEYKTVGFVWVKTNKKAQINQFSFLPSDSFDDFFGMGMYTRNNTEYCLIGVRGKFERKAFDVRQIIYSPISNHSKKPDETRDRIVKLCGDLPRVELFARNHSEGWSVFGNEVEGGVILPLSNNACSGLSGSAPARR